MAANAPVLYRAALLEGRTDIGVSASGQVVGLIDDIPSCAELIDRIIGQATEVLGRLSGERAMADPAALGGPGPGLPGAGLPGAGLPGTGHGLLAGKTVAGDGGGRAPASGSRPRSAAPTRARRSRSATGMSGGSARRPSGWPSWAGPGTWPQAAGDPCDGDRAGRRSTTSSTPSPPRLGRIDVLVNNVGLGGDGQLVDMTDEQWSRVLDVTLTAHVPCHPGGAAAHGAARQRSHRQQRVRPRLARPGGPGPLRGGEGRASWR